MSDQLTKTASDQIVARINDLKEYFQSKFDDQKERDKASIESIIKMVEKIEKQGLATDSRLVKLEKAVIGFEFKHNWKMALMVFIGSATPVATGIFALWFSTLVGK